MVTRVQSLQVGRIAPLGPQGVRSGFVKRPVPGPVPVTMLGLGGDEQADLRVHGGPDKAVYGYCAEHYRAWLADFPEHARQFTAGGFGENLTIAGLDEGAIVVGEVHRIGTALLQVCQPRQPCFKLALRFGDHRLGKAMVASGRAGWYYRVLDAGAMAAGDGVEIVDRPASSLPFARLVEIVNTRRATPDELAAMVDMPGLASSLRRAAQDMLAARRGS